MQRLFSAAVALSLATAALFACSATDDASPNESASTGGGGLVGGTRATGGAANAGGRTGAGGVAGGAKATGGRTGGGGVAATGGAKATGGGPSAGSITQACASACNVLAQTNLTCVPDPCASGCEQAYANAAASSSSCQSAYLNLLQCGARQPASDWTCYYYGLIAAPTTGCSAEMAALEAEDLLCYVALAGF